MKLKELEGIIRKLIDRDAKPVVVYAALWPFMKAFQTPFNEVPAAVFDLLIKIVGPRRSLLMPTFTSGYKNGICNLDEEPSTTGVLSEMFRRHPLAQRTLSAFFPFNIVGPDTQEVAGLQPEDVWGEGSLYEWMEKQNVHFLMLGTHPTHCSYIHRMEWLNREKINYRYRKAFEGALIRNGERIPMREHLFVRSLTPPVVNDFTVLFPVLCQGGMRDIVLDGVHIAHMRAHGMKKVVMDSLERDPLMVVKNRKHYEIGVRT